MKHNYIVTIDGGAATGKTTIARALADRLHISYLSSGMLYRRIAFNTGSATAEQVRDMEPHMLFVGDYSKTDGLMTEEIGARASMLSQDPAIRKIVNERLRSIMQDYKNWSDNKRAIIVEGRDMGTEVFPQADVKFFFKADVEIRAFRRFHQVNGKDACLDPSELHQLTEEIEERDARDTERNIAPLRPAADAFIIDTSALSIDEITTVMESIISKCDCDTMRCDEEVAVEKEARRAAFDKAYMNMAVEFSKLSRAIRRKVGCIIVSKDDQIISQGFNGTPTSADNCCETVDHNGQLRSLSSVLHAETNAMAKCMRYNISTVGATMYVTTSPCIDCAKMIVQSGITRVVYRDQYRNTEGLVLLRDCGVRVDQISTGDEMSENK